MKDTDAYFITAAGLFAFVLSFIVSVSNGNEPLYALQDATMSAFFMALVMRFFLKILNESLLGFFKDNSKRLMKRSDSEK